MTEEKKNKGGRPQIEIDPKLVRELAKVQCTYKEIAAACGCSVDTLERRFAEIIESERETGKSSLRKLQFEAAKNGSVPMLIWLGRVYLGQRDQELSEIKEIKELIVSIHPDRVPDNAQKI